MTPQDIAAGHKLLVPFIATIGYIPPWPSHEDSDMAVLLSSDGTKVIAALWPEEVYDVDLDLSDDQFRDVPLDKGVARYFRHRDTVAKRFDRLLELAAQACGRDPDDVRAHVEWSAGLSSRELANLLRGEATFEFPVIVSICGALHLEFTDHWVVREPARLARRVDRSLLARQVTRRLHRVPTDTLAGLTRKLPRGSKDADQAFEPGPGDVPPPERRYAALYEALALDTRDAPRYSVSTIDKLLKAGGEAELPDNAREDRSWWSGTGAKAKGRPQVRAWWAAGYRVKEVITDPTSRLVTAIQLERVEDANTLTPAAHAQSDHEGPKSAPTDALLDDPGPDDEDIRTLTTFLVASGEADRAQIDDLFRQHPRAGHDDSWVTNLLTRARRQGWVTRYGTRSRPRWVASGTIADRILEIADTLDIDWPAVDPGPPTQQYLEVVADKLGLHIPAGASLAEVVQVIVEAGEQRWEAGFTTKDGEAISPRGMEAVLRAVKHLH